ncbi:MAG: hypothetical protein OQK01_01335, partial [Xanthomonadales bacterium]|nr:hypothetical protein [Xanthomonadales bacterium]
GCGGHHLSPGGRCRGQQALLPLVDVRPHGYQLARLELQGQGALPRVVRRYAQGGMQRCNSAPEAPGSQVGENNVTPLSLDRAQQYTEIIGRPARPGSPAPVHG